jgi:ribosomal protein L6P/L9E
MELVKIVNLNNKITLKIENFNKNLFFYFNSKKKVVLKITLNGRVFLKNGNLTVLNNLTYTNCINYIRFITRNFESFLYNHYSHFSKLHMIGLGFKNFILGDKLYILVGDCNYIIFFIPNSLKVFCKKNQIFVLGESNVEIFNFISNIKRVKKSNFYKGKGILQFKNFKFTKLKVGKKQRFM